MASYYPEGECYFVRSSLRYSSHWSADNQASFYRTVLLEYYWNGWPATGVTQRSHPRSRWQHGTPSGVGGTRFGDWDRFWVGESRNKSPSDMLRIHSHPNSNNWNECRDHQRGGPRKYILRPVEIQHNDTQWLWIDATIPLRAIYFPVAFSTDQAFPNLCTYVVVDFRHRTQLLIRGTDGVLRNLTVNSHNGLGWHDNLTWGFNITDIIAYLSIPHKLRNPDYGLFTSKQRGQELVVSANSTIMWRSSSATITHRDFFREMDFARILSANFGVEVGWRPYQHNPFLRDLLLRIAQLGLGFIPGVGPILSVAFGIGVQLLIDPDSFGRDNVLDLSFAVLESVISSGKRSQKFIAPDWLAQCPCGGQQRGVPLTDQQREARKKLGEEINNRLTAELNAQPVIRSLEEQEKLLTRRVEEVHDEATETTQEAELGEEPDEKQEAGEQGNKDEAEATGEKHD
ncbi:uncharacterized protein FSUBG_4506 [Fusarium subglutinans]|uniref:Uncharacterized protein n=1 Tax=Gibberella subglutinans TaxID=42677 RepID=A0A8H5Q5K2_GIBSU|nr:uncharacterized protein FSUBG_4506 [Fusarium subglutinans]KAF5608578.1 hypothetical protein FSUBG_4506 [Fusarium subglutinans]